MPLYVGLDSSKHTTAICVVDHVGTIVKEGVVPSEPAAITAFLADERRRYARVGIEAWSLAGWLYVELAKAGLPIICIETWYASQFLKAARRNKTDRNDARGIAELMRTGAYKAVPIKTPENQKLKALLTVRKMLRSKGIDIENAIGSVLLSFGMKLPRGRQSTFEKRVGALIASDAFVRGLVEPLLPVRREILEASAGYDERLRQIAADDPVCRRLMTAPGVGYLVALTYRVAIDEPARFASSREVAAYLGLTPVVRESGTKRRVGCISRAGDAAARSGLYIAALHQFRRCDKPSWLRTWALQVAERRGVKKAAVAVARRLAIVLHHMWISETDFPWSEA